MRLARVDHGEVGPAGSGEFTDPAFGEFADQGVTGDARTCDAETWPVYPAPSGFLLRSRPLIT
ncbi:hypothetical protein GCM10010149_61200 [Nonomuraea roseoviolacea subsp. roseoviolacea]